MNEFENFPYKFIRDKNRCMVYDINNVAIGYLGSVVVTGKREYTINYSTNNIYRHMPTNECLKILGYYENELGV